MNLYYLDRVLGKQQLYAVTAFLEIQNERTAKHNIFRLSFHFINERELMFIFAICRRPSV